MTQPARTTRTYGQFCPVAAGLDVIGDRWVLLILRELLTRPRRFSEIKRACRGIAPNLLTERLRTLTDRGLIKATSHGYELTEAGARVGPVLRALAIFGVEYIDPDHPSTPSPEDADAMHAASAFLMPYQDADLPPMRVRVSAPNGTVCDMVKNPGDRFAVAMAAEGEPDVAMTVATEDLWLARRDRQPFRAEVTGAKSKVTAFLNGFALDGLVR